MSKNIDKRAKIGKNSYISKYAQILGHCIIGDGTFIEDDVILGFPYSGEIEKFMELYRSNKQVTPQELIEKPTIIGNNCRIRSGSKISAGAKLGNSVYVDFNSFIGTETEIGDNCIVGYMAQIYDEVKIRENSWICGFVGDRCKIGNNVTMMGKLIHKYNFKPERRPVYNEKEESPTIEDYAVIGFDALVVGPVTVGEKAYVAAGAVVTKDVAPYDVVAGVSAKSIRKKVKLI